MYPLETNEYYWKVVSFVSPEILNAHTHKLRNKLLLLYAVLIVLTGTGSWFLANAQINRKLAETELKKHRDNLEELVKGRTSELTAANEQLQKEMSERKRAEEKLQLAKETAENANRSKSTFLTNMSHELRTPLNAIIGYSEILIEEAGNMNLQNFISDLHNIQVSGKHLLSLINEILDISKLEVGKVKLQLETFDVRSLTDEVVGASRLLAEKNINTLQVHCAPDLDTMHADPAKVRQALFSLLNNACKFTEKGTITLNVTREAVNGENWIIFSVSDTGIGIGPEEKEGLFQSFTQADSSTTRKLEGAGLGLAISKRFCQMMGGDITVKSELGKGSTFTMRLPVNGV
jgi:signal transduction histidine kinase